VQNDGGNLGKILPDLPPLGLLSIFDPDNKFEYKRGVPKSGVSRE
jgi:hypothetical protein